MIKNESEASKMAFGELCNSGKNKRAMEKCYHGCHQQLHTTRWHKVTQQVRTYSLLDDYPASLGFPVMHRVHAICTQAIIAIT